MRSTTTCPDQSARTWLPKPSKLPLDEHRSIERFHGTLREECLEERVFDDIAHAQAVIDDFVDDYNTSRPHQSLKRRPPAERFAARAPDTGPGLDLTALTQRRGGPEWVSRRVAANGIVCVGWQQVSVGKHRHGDTVDVNVTDRLLHIWSGQDLLRTVVRESKGEIRKKRAGRPATS